MYLTPDSHRAGQALRIIPQLKPASKKVIHDCLVEQDNPPPLKFRHPGLVVFAGTLSIHYVTQPRCSSTFKGHLGHLCGTVSCHRGLGEQIFAPSSLARCQVAAVTKREEIPGKSIPFIPSDRLWVTWKNTQSRSWPWAQPVAMLPLAQPKS